MNFKKNTLSTSAVLLAAMLTGGYLVQADDDHKYDKEQEYHEQDKNYSDGDYEKDYDKDDLDENESVDPLNSNVAVQDTWNNWSRTSSFDKGSLPFTKSKKVTLQLESKRNNDKDKLSFIIIPLDGELFVPGKAVAEALGAKASFYRTSQILEVTTENTEIILKAKTNVAYENNIYTPLPAVALSMKDDLYIPISVITNGLGYSVDWQQKDNLFICRTTSIN